MEKRYDYLVVGCGFSGIVLAERLSSIGKKVLIIDKRNHIGGNCYDYKSGNILVQKYGPHIFHTKNKDVFEYLNKFTKFNNYQHKVLAYYDKRYFPIPINLNTVNKFFNINLKDEKELKIFLKDKVKVVKKIKNSEDVVVSKFGEKLYEAFVKIYTKKQWDKYPHELDKSVLERLPIRYNKNDFYYDDLFQGMPEKGFKRMFEKMLSNKNISIKLDTPYTENLKNIAKEIIWTGKIDEYFNYKFEKLEYRSVDFIFEKFRLKNFLPNSVVNFTEERFKFLRITEFKKFYGIKSKKTIICREFYFGEGEPAYPVYNKKNLKLLKKYLNESEKEKNIYFLGRLGRYKYINMDQCVEEALELFEKIKNR
ncbi:MAG: UDP-galactopyranose mutase [Candidatus Diapherotrites archaeon]